MAEERFRRGDRVDYNNSRSERLPNGTPGTIRRVIVTRKYIVDWDDGLQDLTDEEPYGSEELIRIEEN